MSLHFSDDPKPEPQEHIVPGIIPRGVLTVISGPPGGGKTALAATLATAAETADGRWLGLDVDTGPVCWFAFEATTSTRRRLAALDPKGLAPVCVIGSPPNLLSEKAFELICAALDAAEHRFGRPVETLVIDALASAMRGGDENSGKDVGKAMGVLLRLIDTRGVSVLLLAHTGKNGGADIRGHSSVLADASAALSIVGDGPMKRLRVLKQRDAEPGPDIAFRAVEIDGALTVEKVEDAAAKPQRRPDGLRPDAALALEALKEMASEIGGPIALADWQATTLQRFGDRSPGALREAWRKARRALVEGQHIRIDGDRVTVTARHHNITGPSGDGSGGVTTAVTTTPSVRGGGNAGDAHRRAPLRVVTHGGG